MYSGIFIDKFNCGIISRSVVAKCDNSCKVALASIFSFVLFDPFDTFKLCSGVYACSFVDLQRAVVVTIFPSADRLCPVELRTCNYSPAIYRYRCAVASVSAADRSSAEISAVKKSNCGNNPSRY